MMQKVCIYIYQYTSLEKKRIPGLEIHLYRLTRLIYIVSLYTGQLPGHLCPYYFVLEKLLLHLTGCLTCRHVFSSVFAAGYG